MRSPLKSGLPVSYSRAFESQTEQRGDFDLEANAVVEANLMTAPRGRLLQKVVELHAAGGKRAEPRSFFRVLSSEIVQEVVAKLVDRHSLTAHAAQDLSRLVDKIRSIKGALNLMPDIGHRSSIFANVPTENCLEDGQIGIRLP